MGEAIMSQAERELFASLVSEDTGWRWLVRGVKFNPLLRDAMIGKSGGYAIRVHGDSEVEYVGHSHTDRLWKTCLRHLHAQKSFEKIAQGEWTYRGDREVLEVRVWVTLPEDAEAIEAALIRLLKPRHNRVKHPKDWEDKVDEEIPF